jgi:PRTRC genetic system protein C
MATIKAPTRVFKFGSLQLPDPDPSMTPDDVRALYAANYPSLHAFTVSDPEVSHDTLVYTFKAPEAKTKGAEASQPRASARVRGLGRAAGGTARRTAAQHRPDAARQLARAKPCAAVDPPRRATRARTAPDYGPLGAAVHLGFDALTLDASAFRALQTTMTTIAAQMTAVRDLLPVARVADIALHQRLITPAQAEACLRRAVQEGLRPLQALIADAIERRACERMARAGFSPVAGASRFSVIDYYTDELSVHAESVRVCDISGLLKASPAVTKWVLRKQYGLGALMCAPDVLFAHPYYTELSEVLYRLALIGHDADRAELDQAFMDAMQRLDVDECEDEPYLIGIGGRDEFQSLYQRSRDTLRVWAPFRCLPNAQRPVANSVVDEQWLACVDQLTRAKRSGLGTIMRHCEQRDEYPLDYGTVLTLSPADKDFWELGIDCIDSQNGEPIGTNFPINKGVPLESALLVGYVTVAVADLLERTSKECLS